MSMPIPRVARLTLALCAAALAACSGISDPLVVVRLEGELRPADEAAEPVTGSVAMVIGERQTQIGIGVAGALEGDSLGWRVRNGGCTDSGDRIGPAAGFPAIGIEEDGTGEAETILFRRIDPAGTYVAEVLTGPDGTGTVVACAALSQPVLD